MNNEKTIEVLNTLVEINNDRIEGYETAVKETDEIDLKSLFARLIHTSLTCKQELIEEIHKMGGMSVTGTRTSGKFFRVWMDVKAAITGKDRRAILDSCEYGEDVAVDTYEKALENNLEYLTPEHQTLLNAQHEMIKADHDTIKELRDLAAELV